MKPFAPLSLTTDDETNTELVAQSPTERLIASLTRFEGGYRQKLLKEYFINYTEEEFLKLTNQLLIEYVCGRVRL